MKRVLAMAAMFLLTLLPTSSIAQTRTSQLVITNSTGTTTFSQTTDGIQIDNNLVLQRPGYPGSTVTLVVPQTGGNTNFAFPTTGGTVVTNNCTNAWSGLQTFQTTVAQGNALINSINAGNIALTGYATTSAMNTAISSAMSNTANYASDVLLESDLNVSSPLTKQGTGSITLGLATSGVTAGTYKNACLTVDPYGRVTSAASGGGAMIAGRTSTNLSSNGDVNYYAITGTTAGNTTALSVTDNQIRIPFSGTVKNFYVDVSSAPGASKSRSFTVRNVTTGTDLGSITITGASTSGSSGAAALAVNAGDILVVQHSSSGNPTNAQAVWSFMIQ
jgi:hypothetical protein